MNLELGGFTFSDDSPLQQALASGSLSNSSNASTEFKQLVEDILLTETEQHRVTVMITTSFSLVASLLVILVVLWDARSAQKRRLLSKAGIVPSLWDSVHTAEVFPFMIAIAAVVQSTVFLSVQSTTLRTFWAAGCDKTAQIMWPATWIVAFTVLVFSLESTFRSLRRARFQPRGKWHVPISLAIILKLLLAVWLATNLLRSAEICWGSLLWWTLHYNRASVVLTAAILLINMITASVLVFQLMNTVRMDRDERIAASRVVYSLYLNIVILAFVLPFWVTLTTMKINETASMIADVMISLNGLLQGVFHLMLRANSERLAIHPRRTPWSKKRSLRIFGPNDLNIHDFISTPLLCERESDRWPTALKDNSIQKDVFGAIPSTPREQFATLRSPASSQPPPMALSRPKSAVPKRTQPKSQYSIFPTEKSERAPVESWITEASRDSDWVEPPPRLLISRHGRNDSTLTSETVEIGLRLSHAIPEEMTPHTTSRLFSPLTPVRSAPEEGLLSPDRYVPPSKIEMAQQENLIAATAQPTLVNIPPPPPLPMSGVGLKPGKMRRVKSIRDSLAAISAPYYKKEAMKSLPAVPRNKTVAGPIAPPFINSSNTQAIPTNKSSVPDWRRPAPAQAASSDDPSDNSWPLPIQRPMAPSEEGWL